MSDIDVWLDSQPDDPSDYEPEHARPSKRARLAEVPVNMAESPRRSERRRSPRKGSTAAAPRTPPHSSLSSEHQHAMPFLDDGETPKAAAAAPSIAAFPVLQPPSSSSIAVLPAAVRPPSPPSRSSTSSWTSGASSRRQRSPVRRLGDLQLSDVRVQAVPLQKPGQAPADVRDLCREIRRIGSGLQLIPSAVKGHATELLDDGLLQEAYFVDNDDDDNDQRVEQERFWETANTLIDSAYECEEEEANEPEWNTRVHAQALELALSPHRSERRVFYRNITTAKIQDESLLPTTAAGLATRSKMVDYAMVLDTRSDKSLKERVYTKLRYEELPGINHTPAECVRFSPIAVSIETKRSAIEEDVANVQLAVWVSAHFCWLRQLGREGCSPPTLPLVIVQGHEWKLMLAALGNDTNITIYRQLNLGTTRTILGVYQIVASLTRLADWVSKTYRPWFEGEVLSIP